MTTIPAPAEAFHEVLDHRNRPNPYPCYARLAEQPVTRVDDRTWVVTRYADISRLLRDPRMSAVRRPGGGVEPEEPPARDEHGNPIGIPFLRQDPPNHDRLRRAVMDSFVPRITAMRGRVETLVDGLLESRAGAGTLDVVADLAYPLPVSVICELLGVPESDEPVFQEFARVLTRSLDPVESLTEQEQRETEQQAAALREYVGGMIQHRMANPGDDLLSDLLAADEPMHVLDLGTTLGLLLIAGHETTVNLITNGVLALLRNPAALADLRADDGLAVPLVEEVLRYDPPVQMTARTTRTDVEVAGTTIPAASRVTMLLAAGNRDAGRFADPDRFWPRRPDNAHLGFGGGIHYCVGAALARAEAQVALTALANRLRNPRLVVDPPPYRRNAVLRGPERLPVAFDGLAER
ncbi:cytochrome P450 [Saccharopolyspora rosea]|uniref:cytochrome P450 n=1 Tax=Saccharopolyspora rosea TaxID=524884 RepID=UPI0021DA56DA|nr:cytochrome P450 [Saccharopolyspora rosea]